MTKESGISRVHDFRDMSMEEAYDETQVNDGIRTGDVLLVEDGIAIMSLAWPVMVFGSSQDFHSLVDTTSWELFLKDHLTREDRRRARDGLLLAWAIATG